MDDTIYDTCFNSLIFGAETTIGCFDFSDEAVENVGMGLARLIAGRLRTLNGSMAMHW